MKTTEKKKKQKKKQNNYHEIDERTSILKYSFNPIWTLHFIWDISQAEKKCIAT